MNVADMTFGVEIETIVTCDDLAIGPHGRGYAIPELPGWKADADPSLRGAGRGCEFVSPVLRGAEGLAALVEAVRTIKDLFGASVNSSCGLHVHVGFNRGDGKATQRLVTLTSNFQKAIFASTGTRSRENGRWCRGVQGYGDVARASVASMADRYHVLNLGTGRPTAEFRAFAGTLNVQKIIGYVRLCLGLVERAYKAKRIAAWVGKEPAPTSPQHRNGIGQTQLTRLYYQLGWTKGRSNHAYGNLEAVGAPDLLNSKRTLMKMARKYDGSERSARGMEE